MKQRLLFAGVAVLGILLLAEGAMQVLALAVPGAFKVGGLPPEEGYTMAADDRLVFRMVPGALGSGPEHEESSQDSNGEPQAWPKPKGSYRIMYFGDSSVFGAGLPGEHAFPRLSDRMLNASGERQVDTVNAATPGHSSTQSRLLFEDNFHRIGADALVVASLWSDIIVRPWTDAEMLRHLASEGYRFESGLRRSLRVSALFRFIEVKFEDAKGIPKDRIVALRSIINDNIDYTDEGEPRVSPAQHSSNLRAMAIRARELGADVFFVILHCDPEHLPWPAARLRAYRQNYYDLATELGAPLIDAAKIYGAEGAPASDFFTDGLHPNARGHRLIAEALVRAVRGAPGYLRSGRF